MVLKVDFVYKINLQIFIYLISTNIILCRDNSIHLRYNTDQSCYNNCFVKPLIRAYPKKKKYT